METTVPIWLTCVIGVGVVFAGLICLVLICSIIGLFFKNVVKEKPVSATAPAPAVQDNTDPAKRGELVAAASAAIAESLGKDVNAIRIVSFKKK